MGEGANFAPSPALDFMARRCVLDVLLRVLCERIVSCEQRAVRRCARAAAAWYLRKVVHAAAARAGSMARVGARRACALGSARVVGLSPSRGGGLVKECFRPGPGRCSAAWARTCDATLGGGC